MEGCRCGNRTRGRGCRTEAQRNNHWATLHPQNWATLHPNKEKGFSLQISFAYRSGGGGRVGRRHRFSRRGRCRCRFLSHVLVIEANGDLCYTVGGGLRLRGRMLRRSLIDDRGGAIQLESPASKLRHSRLKLKKKIAVNLVVHRTCSVFFFQRNVFISIMQYITE